MFVKICGIRFFEDAKTALEAQASAIGFVSYKKSSRFVNPEDVKYICSTLPFKWEDYRRVLVCVDEDIAVIKEYVKAGINTVQLHGEETGDAAQRIKDTFKRQVSEFEVWKVIKIKTNLSDFEEIKIFNSFPADKFLIDTFSEKEAGGTGRACDWAAAKYAVETLPRPVILAGGLNLNNVCEAIKTVRPFGVDVSSGVEKSPGIKSSHLIKEFVKMCR